MACRDWFTQQVFNATDSQHSRAASPPNSIMPSRNSAKKRLRQNIAQRAKNRSTRSTVRTQVNKVRAAVAAGDAKTSATEFQLAVKKLDKAASQNVMHANAAARTKSRLSKAIKAIGS